MVFTKITHLRKLIEGVGFQSKAGKKLNEIIDPTIVASLVRNLYETVGLFNLIYVNTKNNDEKNILYSLWVISGLKYRQRFKVNISRQENEDKLNEEQEEINILVRLIEQTELYRKLNEVDKKKIHEMIKKKEYKMRFENNEVKFLTWQDLSTTLGCDEKLFGTIYTYFSLYSHPSQVAVFQFNEMFSIEAEEFKKITTANLNYCFSILSIFVADYIKLFPRVKSTYDKLPLKDQIVINYHNKMVRGEHHSINDAWRYLI